MSLVSKSDPNVDKLIHHEINETVKFNGENIVYCKDGRIACDRGLTTLLSVFFEGYKRPTKADIKEYCARTGKTIIPPRDVVRVGDSWEKVTLMEKDCNKSGRSLGTLVHNQLCLYARSKNEDEFTAMCPKPHDYTVRAIRKLSQAGILVFFAEFAIVDPLVKYVTAIDLVGVNSNGKLTIVEVKTGYENIFPIGKVPLKVPFDAWENSALNQARLQLLLPCLTLKYQYKVNVDSAWVLNVNSQEEKLYPLLRGMTTNPHTVYNYLIDNYGARSKVSYSLSLPSKEKKKNSCVKKKSYSRGRIKKRRRESRQSMKKTKNSSMMSRKRSKRKRKKNI